MVRILFICHGNICRSPMAEFLLKDMVSKRGLSAGFEIASAATSREEIGNPVHHGTRNKLAKLGISVAGKTAVQMTKKDYDHYDYVIAMDDNNMRGVERIVGRKDLPKAHKLLDFTGRPGNIADPWYSGDFNEAFRDIDEGCRGLLAFLEKEGKI